MESTLYQIFKKSYNRDSFEKNVLTPIFNKSVKDYIIYNKEGEQEVALTDTEKRTAKKVVKYGEFKTHDNRKIELYEVTVEDFGQVKIARVGLGALVKKLIIGNNAVFATFKYEDVIDKHWRFSFIAYDSFFEDGQVQTKETNPKRYTYVFGDTEETYRTAIDRFQELDSKFQIKVKDIQEAFAVEAMSKEFFDEYRETHYAKFVKYLTGEEFQKKGGKYELVKAHKPPKFLKEVFNENKDFVNDNELTIAKKYARDFCKKLLGQIVFLYFLQKKGWMASPTGDYEKADGDKNFLENYFIESGSSNNFYKDWLSKLFYETLNKPRKNDDFEMPKGEIVKIPYLNGGLFEKDYENLNLLEFPNEYFSKLFEFFNRFNFTIYENSPEEHTIAVDPEMLGHIFENLLEDNKDKGAFYTPKEIVQYMTQESLIEYLVTHLGDNVKDGISLFVKQKNKEGLRDTQLKEIDNLLDKVKICDPAIGSGAFPMGLLHEIFTLKERIAFDLGFKVWSPATVKENIIQNSIYGVDIEKGAVDIAQLRFWLSLIVDEEKPKPLPNLVYKIVVGDSLVSKFGDEIIEIDWEVEEGTQSNLFGNPHQERIQDLLKQISEKQKEYFKANNKTKPRLAKEIRLLKLNILSEQLELMISSNPFHKQDGKKLTKAQNERINEIKSWKKTLEEVDTLKNNEEPFNHFDWRLDFPEILNPIVNENTGFDIVIGNPPYGVSIKGNYRESVLKSLGKVPDFEIYYYFTEKAHELVKDNGVLSYIIPNTYLFNTFAASYRIELFNKWELTEILDCTKFNIFQTATVKNTINTWKKGSSQFVGYRKTKDQENFSELIQKQRTSLSINDLIEMNQNWGLAFMLDSKIIDIVSTINEGKNELQEFYEISQGYIPYRRSDLIKVYGKEEGNQIVNERLWHSDYQVNSDYLPEIFGRELDKYGNINKSKISYIKYGKHLAGYIDLKFFNQKRILVREITNPRIIATLITETFVNDPQLISIIEKEDLFTLEFLWAILNSKLATFYHFNYSPKATKGAFPKILVKDIREFPLVYPNGNRLLETLVAIVFQTNKRLSLSINKEVKNEIIAKHFEEIIDGCVFELYFKEHMESNDIAITQLVEKEINNVFGDSTFDSLDDDKKGKLIWELYEVLTHPDHPVRNKILKFPIVSPNILKPILQS
ncbi:TaqI-like C-terminal specificity domain-containing protein [Tenacibaculum tangerinum]|uniref:site-specific DNA-methyltransferase (adenine-specific) n=1 Tax=Tenacibaculum tangerinum TaxID=3038772 RepID=A0ABY8L805_9FLAO|nr:TaqI-like C-terminal specificity domain-containing protein [Tenacibaculum tangerinum]WGH76518.1 TaqI-like C-terminal specificity domain-containing protein [Tenacibaculum tangerinum]